MTSVAGFDVLRVQYAPAAGKKRATHDMYVRAHTGAASDALPGGRTLFVVNLPPDASRGSLRDLFREMNKAPEAFPPLVFLSLLRKVAPQFAEMAQGGGGFAQQDAEEAYVRILNALGAYLALNGGQDRFVQEYLTGHMSIEYVASG